jgi:hypothetical protein
MVLYNDANEEEKKLYSGYDGARDTEVHRAH